MRHKLRAILGTSECANTHEIFVVVMQHNKQIFKENHTVHVTCALCKLINGKIVEMSFIPTVYISYSLLLRYFH